MIFAYGVVTLFDRPFQGRSANQSIGKLSPDKSGHYYLTTPSRKFCPQTSDLLIVFANWLLSFAILYLQTKFTAGFGLIPVRSPLLREFCEAKFQISKFRYLKNCFTLFSFPPLTEMFHFSGCAPLSRIGISNF